MDAASADALDGTEPAEEAIPRLVDAYGGRLYALGKRFCGNEEEAKDLVQEVFLAAFRKWKQFEGRSKPSTWLFTIASRACRRMHRRRSGEPRRIESLDELLPFAEDRMAVVPEDELARAELAERSRREVERAIAELPAVFRMPFVLKELAGFPVEEVAAILGVKEATVKTRLHRARLRVRKALEPKLPRRALPPTPFSRALCLDLLAAKQEALDRGLAFEFPGEVICERCAELFASLDLEQGVCRSLAEGELPESLREAILARASDGG
jgi:RNA polymerase sigma-70 factor (ECF subfamily)